MGIGLSGIMDPETLMKKAREAVDNAIAPYSNFKVGAAALTSSGKIYTGCNIENVSYGLTICAERLAAFKAASEGEEVEMIAIFTSTGNSSPCGACRQVLLELNKNMIIYFLKDGQMVKRDIAELLPAAFDRQQME